jgi:uncharacterized protein
MIMARTSLFALLVCWTFAAHADVAVPPLSGRVVDQTGTLSAGDISSLTEALKDFEARKGSQVVVLIVPTTAPETIEQFSIRVAEAWKIGRKKIDDGVLLVVAKNNHTLRIEVGYGLEGALTDVTSKRIIDEVIGPKFQSGDFAGGISLGVEWIFAVIDGEKLPAPQSSQSSRASQSPARAPNQRVHQALGDWVDQNPMALIILILVAATLYTVLGRLTGSLAAGCLVGGLVWYFFGLLLPACILGGLAFFFTWYAKEFSRPSLPWPSESSSSSDNSGFSGEGGGFGGGGASGKW